MTTNGRGRGGRLKFEWFLPGMAAAVALAWLWPTPGAAGGWLHPELLTKAGIAVIFFLHGGAMSFAALKAGTLQWRLHTIVQACTFLVFPLLGLAVLALAGRRLAPDFALGIFFLCALPSTVSSSVAMTAAARGNVAGAVFNATLSSLLGIFLTPFWISWRLHAAGQSLPLGQVVLDLVLWLLLPLLVGQFSRRWLAAWALRQKRSINVVDRLVILLLVYTSFCDSVRRGIWSGQGWSTLAFAVVLSAGLFFAVMAVAEFAAKAWGLPVEDRIAAVFCGSKKTLASGVPMAHLIFGAYPGLGLVLLPIMIYHPLQLIIAGVLAQRWSAGNRRP